MQVLDSVRPDAQGLPSLEDDPRWAAMQRVLASKGFAKSFRLISLLTYICRCALENRSDEVTEQQIGLHVFERAADYNPGEDNIVRTTARQLRQKLAVYYQEEGANETLRIDIPRGGYHPIFSPVPEMPSGFVGAQHETTQDRLSFVTTSLLSPNGIVLTRSAIVICILVIFFIGAAVGLLANHWSRRGISPLPLGLAQIFTPGRTTVFVAGDSGLNIYDNLARTQLSLGEYVSGDYLKSVAAQPASGYSWPSLATRRYTSFVDMQISDRLRTFAQDRGVPMVIHFARDVHAEDLRHANVILAGAGTYNPWISMFDSKLNFHLHYDGEKNATTVLNANPLPGEPRQFFPEEPEQDQRGYSHGFGYIALTANLEGDGQVLLIEGSTVAGVDAALQFVLNDSKMATIMKQAKTSQVEILLEADFIKSSSPNARVLALRTY